MCILEGQGLFLKLPYADGGDANYARPYLVIEVGDTHIKILNVSSTRGKERKLIRRSNKPIKKYKPPFIQKSFVKIDAVYDVEICDELKETILHQGDTLDRNEFNKIVGSFNQYKNDKKVDSVTYDTSEVMMYNSNLFAIGQTGVSNK